MLGLISSVANLFGLGVNVVSVVGVSVPLAAQVAAQAAAPAAAVVAIVDNEVKKAAGRKAHRA